jgi:PAS domain S-box-containing protein
VRHFDAADDSVTAVITRMACADGLFDGKAFAVGDDGLRRAPDADLARRLHPHVSMMTRPGECYEELVDTVRCAVARMTPDLHITEFNREAERVFGWRREEVIGRPFADVVGAEPHRANVLDDLGRALAGEDIGWNECRFAARDGSERFLLWTARKLAGPDGHAGLVAVGQDLTARRQAERRAHALEAEAEQRRRLAELGAIAARIVHDVGSPLTTAALTVARLRRLAERRETRLQDVPDELGDLEASLRSIGELVEGCRSFVREQRLDVARFSVTSLLMDVRRAWAEDAAQRGIGLELLPAAQLGTILADGQKLRRVLDNLVKNALEAIDQGPGLVILAARPLGASEILISVQDSGPGLPKGIDVFAAFETTKTNGTGLGLAIARQFVEAHGGTLAARPAEPHGTRFEIALPREPPGQPPARM